VSCRQGGGKTSPNNPSEGAWVHLQIKWTLSYAALMRQWNKISRGHIILGTYP
jgi:hypothetical protein